ncbi:hypothetical protein M0R04_08310 [Candidatus Dojkabacteria bacterium]|jgi:hypothetical protein|nr:hypothetical protein [Candidatus Dojkabacteria bacterium]
MRLSIGFSGLVVWNWLEYNQVSIKRGYEMNKQELTQAVTMAKDRTVKEPTDISIFGGFGLKDFEPVYVTLDKVAALINWQCLQFNGEYDAEALNEIAIAGRKKFIIIG